MSKNIKNRISCIEKLRNIECEKCNLCETAQSVCLIGQGPCPCNLILVGEAPGQREDDVCKPFQGRSGKLLQTALRELGKIEREEIFITNAVKCRPPENRTPSKKEVTACKDYLLREIELVNPQYGLIVGATAFQAIFKKSGIMKHRGEIVEKDGVKYLITIHPSAALRQPRLKPLFDADITRFGNLVRGKLDKPKGIKWTLANSSSLIKSCFRDIRNSKVISYDIETSGTDDYLSPEGEIYCIGLSTKSRSWVIPLSYPGSPFIKPDIQRKIIKTLLIALENKSCVAHNGKFDNKYLTSKFGSCPSQTFDTMLAAYTLDENRPLGLKPLSQMYFGAPQYEIKMPIDKEEVPLKKLAEYCAYDVHYTRKLYFIFKKQLKEDSYLHRIYRKLIMPASRILEEVELRGIYVDTLKYPKSLKECSRKVKRCLEDLNRIAGTDKLNWNSPQQVAKLLFTDLKLPVLEKTATGKPSTSGENVLPRLKDKHPIIQKLLDYRKQVKLLQFLDSWGELMDENNFMHPNYKIHGTVTGRISCTDPNFQQVPRDVFIRSLITAPPGWVLMEADYSQIELRVAAMIADEKNMKRAFQTGEDIHSKTASGVSGVSVDKVDKNMRKKAKAVNFGFLYGMWWKKFREYARDKYEVDLSDDDAREYRDRFFEMYPGLLSWHDRQKRLVKKYGYVRNPLGWKRRLPEINSMDKKVRQEAERQSINSPVQGFASQMCMFLGLIRCSRLNKDKFLPAGLVHDAAFGWIKEGYEDLIVPKVKQIMEDMDLIERVFHTSVTVPIKVEIKLGPWGAGKEWKG